MESSNNSSFAGLIPPAADNRMVHVDALRGLAILLVVYVHTVNYGLFSLHMVWASCKWSPAVIGLKFRMPLFFFVSGLLACGVYDNARFRKRVLNRFRKQLWPTAVVCLTFGAAIGWNGWHSLIYNSVNDRYWFTQSLVQVFLLYAVTARLLNVFRASKRVETSVILFLFLILAAADIWLEKSAPLPKNHFLRYSYLNHTLIYGQFFFLGVLARMNSHLFRRMLESKWVIGAAACYFTAACCIDFGYTGLPTKTAGLISIYALFYHTRAYWGGQSLPARALSELGRNTLPIYLLHYIPLHYLMQAKILTPFTWLYGGWWEIPAVGLFSLLLAYACVALDKALRRFTPVIHTLIFGDGKIYLHMPKIITRFPYRRQKG